MVYLNAIMSTDTYFTISGASEGLFKNKGSRFLAFAFPVQDENEVKDHVQFLKKQYHNARHHCYAYRIGVEEPYLFRMNDDGEPSGTAGKPIFGQILSKQLTNILIVVVRYFGGTLLGTSGLIQAYKAAAEDALLNSTIMQNVVKEKLHLQFGYQEMNAVMRVVKEESVEITQQDFQEECKMDVLVPRKLKDAVLRRLILIEKLNISEI